jgi:23S rRNA pseudouridine1911/1915/1917 synthase
MNTFRIGDIVLYKNNQLIAFNKPSGITSQTDGSADKSLDELASIFCGHPVQVVHRLDRPASGAILYAKNKTAVATMHEQFADREVEKTYYAIVMKAPEIPAATLTNYLEFNLKVNKAFITEDKEKGKEAILSYETVGHSDRYTLLKVKLHTGRQHQIRVQLAAIGSPIRGDVKYGFRRGNKDRSIQLHSFELKFKHPVSGQMERIIAPVPDEPVWKAFEKFIPNE